VHQQLNEAPWLNVKRRGPHSIAIGRYPAVAALKLGDEGVILDADFVCQLAL